MKIVEAPPASIIVMTRAVVARKQEKPNKPRTSLNLASKNTLKERGGGRRELFDSGNGVIGGARRAGRGREEQKKAQLR